VAAGTLGPMDYRGLAVNLAALALSVSVHESAHAWTAWRLGDPTGKLQGRVSLNPLRHVDLFGTLLLPIALWVGSSGRFTFGYAKPVPYNPYALKNPPIGSALIAGMGPVSNLLLALLAAAVLRGVVTADRELLFTLGGEVLYTFMALNVWLALFNLLPFPPLDGGTVLAGFLPRDLSAAYERMQWLGMAALVVLMLTNTTSVILGPPHDALMRVLERVAGFSLV
jgi:Zn-dependent protease